MTTAAIRTAANGTTRRLSEGKEMDEAIRDKWAEKLESGKYDQATGALRQGSAFCCLGVLCEMFREETGEGGWELDGEAGWRFVVNGHSASAALPSPVRDWAGLNSVNPLLRPGDADASAAQLNDYELDFKGIARLVRQLPGKATD